MPDALAPRRTDREVIEGIERLATCVSDGAPDEPQHPVGGWVGLVDGATEGAVGDIEEQGAEHVDDGFHALDERDSGGDRDRTEQ